MREEIFPRIEFTNIVTVIERAVKTKEKKKTELDDYLNLKSNGVYKLLVKWEKVIIDKFLFKMFRNFLNNLPLPILRNKHQAHPDLRFLN